MSASGELLDDSAQTAEKAAHQLYFKELFRLQRELAKLQDWVVAHRRKVVVLFEGRDAAGKGGVIKRITQRMNPRVCLVAALPAPNERERTQWYFQRYDKLASFCRIASSTASTRGVSETERVCAPEKIALASSDGDCRNPLWLVANGPRLVARFISPTRTETVNCLRVAGVWNGSVFLAALGPVESRTRMAVPKTQSQSRVVTPKFPGRPE